MKTPRFIPIHPARVILVAALVAAQTAGAAVKTSARGLTDMTIEELLNESITSVSKKETSLFASPAAIATVTADDLRRLGVTSLPEALRIVPGLQVARINSNKWAVSARGFNGQFANKLLVLIDGRTVYTPAFAGVYWDAQDVVFEDIERIEVIRGPGATLWGANAVNGVINVRTKTAKETQGTLVSGATGTAERAIVALRHGGKLAEHFYYRAFVKHFDRDGFTDPAGRATPDDWNLLHGGARLDWARGARDRLTLQGEYYDGESGGNKRRASLVAPFAREFDAVGRNRGWHALGRWTRELAPGSALTAQAYFDTFGQNLGAELNQERRDTFDIEFQHRFGWAGRHDIVWGAGYRHTHDKLPSNFGLTWTPGSAGLDIANAFAQDEIALVPKQLSVTLGSKFEHNPYTGWEIQPGVRLLWLPRDKQAVWASVARAVRTPSRFERGSRLNVSVFRPAPTAPPFVVSLFTDSTADSEKLAAFELGYRVEPARELSVDVAAFFNRYDDLLTFVPGPDRFEAVPAPPHVLVGPLTMRNVQSGHTYGGEIAAQWRPSESWRLVTGYTRLNLALHPGGGEAGRAPRDQLHLRGYVDLPRNWQLSAAFYYGDRLPEEQAPSFLRFDFGVVWRPATALELGVWGQNLLDRRHFEFGSESTPLRTEVPRSVLVRLVWRF